VSATPSPSADLTEGTARSSRLSRRLFPRTFQGRLTLAFVAVVALTLGLATVLVINRLDDYFATQRSTDLEHRSDLVASFVLTVAESAAAGRAVVGVDGAVDVQVIRALANRETQRFIADQLGQADVAIQFGRRVPDGETNRFVAASGGPMRMELEAPPQAGQSRDLGLFHTTAYGDSPTPFSQYAISVTLSDPYTFRASVTGLLAAVALFALGLSVLVSAWMARRFTAPLRRLTEASRGLAEGDLSRRVPPGEVRAGSSELAELAVQFNTMADRLQESVEIIRHDRDRSRDFLADVSHELRTPLAALRMFNELLKEGAADDPEALSEFLDSSGQQIERLDWLAQNLLELSKLDSGLVLLDLRPDDLRAAVETAVEQTSGAATRRGVRMSVRLPARPIRIRHDPQRIGQVVGNLVANAVKFTPPGGSVAVTAAATADGATIEVVDTGVGIEATELPHIFERFYRGSRANEARGSGSGLGLAIVRSIVDMHGGSVEVVSRVGSGSTFTVTLPSDPRLVEGTPAATRAAVASAAEARGSVADPSPGVPGAASANMQETSPSERPQVNPEPAP
jgi:two-component system, OmpR family, sensor histidine kinase BaeS